MQSGKLKITCTVLLALTLFALLYYSLSTSQQPGHEVQQPGHEVQQPGHDVQQPGHEVQRGSNLKIVPSPRTNSSLVVNSQPYLPLIRDYMLAAKGDLKKKDEFFSSGVGLHNFKTQLGESILWENGVFYRTFPYLESKSNFYYFSQYEPNVPFDLNTFFVNNTNRIERYREMAAAQDDGGLKSGMKKIIIWWQDKVHMTKTMELRPLRMCPDFPCVLTSNKDYTKKSSALIINGQFLNQPRPKRTPDQVFIYYMIEPYIMHGHVMGALHDKYKKAWLNAFNWTMSYRWDSDIPTYYGLIRKRPKPLKLNYPAILSKKRKLVAWIVTNPKVSSGRKEYINELSKYVPVDIFGENGVPKCARSEDWVCKKRVSEEYKFYLSFENSFCQNYITEKFYVYYTLNVVVIARGINEFSNIAPRGTFLNVADFKSAKELAERIQFLDKHDNEYLNILKEKNKYFSVFEEYVLRNINPIYLEYRYEAVTLCHLCHRLWNLDDYRKTIPNINDWFHRTKCYGPHDPLKDVSN